MKCLSMFLLNRFGLECILSDIRKATSVCFLDQFIWNTLSILLSLDLSLNDSIENFLEAAKRWILLSDQFYSFVAPNWRNENINTQLLLKYVC